MKNFRIILVLLTLTAPLLAQTNFSQSVNWSKGQQIKLRFDYPQLIKISTWDKNEISVKGLVSINGGESDDAFKADVTTFGDIISINGEIKGLKDLPTRITLNRDGQKIIFKTKADYEKYKHENGRDYSSMSYGQDIDIQLEIKIPVGAETRIESVYGMVEVKDFNGPLIVLATYGGVDAAIQENATGELSAETNYGQIYSNLDAKLKGPGDADFHMSVSAKLGTGPHYSFESRYGNVYLRKRN